MSVMLPKQAVKDCDYFLDDKMTLITFNEHMEEYGEQIEVIKDMLKEWYSTDNPDVADIISDLQKASEKYQIEEARNNLKELLK